MGHRLEGCGDRRAHITSMALATLDLPLRSYRACFGLNPQHCFVLSDMARESGVMSGGHDRHKLRHPTDVIDRESRRRRRP